MNTTNTNGPKSPDDKPNPLMGVEHLCSGLCVVCGEGKVYPRVSLLQFNGHLVPTLTRECDTCKGQFAGAFEAAANKGIADEAMRTKGPKG
jgi:hypothetical protein